MNFDDLWRQGNVTNENLVSIYHQIRAVSEHIDASNHNLVDIFNTQVSAKGFNNGINAIGNKLNEVTRTIEALEGRQIESFDILINSMIAEIRAVNAGTQDGPIVKTLKHGQYLVPHALREVRTDIIEELQQFRAEIRRELGKPQQAPADNPPATSSDIVKELQQLRAEILQEIKSRPSDVESQSRSSASTKQDPRPTHGGDTASQGDVRDLQSMLVFQQRTTTLALNVIIDLLLPVTGQEHPYPPSLQQKLIQLADRMREAESF